MQYPLQIYIVWQAPKNSKAVPDPCFQLAKAVFSSFSRNTEEPIERGIGIPTFFISEAAAVADNIEWGAAQKTIVVWLITNTMFSSKEAWEEQLTTVLQHSQQLFIPVGITRNADKFSEAIEEANWILLNYNKGLEQQKDLLINKLALCILEELHINQKEKLTLFISYNEIDGGEIAGAVKKLVEEHKLKVDTYVETPRFGNKGAFEKELKNKMGKSIFLIINTNLYNEEDYCLQVLLKAKQHRRPVILLNAQYKVTFRIWPYLGNIPTIQLPVRQIQQKGEKPYLEAVEQEGEQVYQEIVDYIFLEALRFIYQHHFLEMLIQEIKKEAIPFAIAPELLTLHQQNIKDNQLVLYPDPPLSLTEIKLLNQYFNTSIMTPTLYPILSTKIAEQGENTLHTNYETILDDCIVGFSVSEPTSIGDGIYRGVSSWHMQDALVELTRYLFVCGATCAYGGVLKYQITGFNFTTTLVDLSRSYNTHIDSKKRVKNYIVAVDEKEAIAREESYIDYEDVIDFIICDNLEEDIKGVSNSSILITKAKHALNLSNIRKTIFEKHNDAQVCIAGKLEGYTGLLPGVLEEAYWALKEGCPIYIIGAFGGISGALAELLLTGKSQLLKETLAKQQQQQSWQLLYQAYLQEIAINPNWQETARETSKRIQYEDLKLFFLKHRQKVAGNYLENGLSRAENEQLFKTKNILQISSLVLKGLHKYFNLYQ